VERLQADTDESLMSVLHHSRGLVGRTKKSSAITEMGDRLAIIDMGRKVGAAVPLCVGS